jgi:hypothetical protein
MKKNSIVPFCSTVSELSGAIAVTVTTVFPNPMINFELIDALAPAAILVIVPLVFLPIKAPPIRLILH